MLRQLFISIIILSALTSESIVNLPGCIIASFQDVKGALLMQEEPAAFEEKESRELHAFSSSSSELFILSPRSFHIFELKHNKMNLAKDDADRGYFPVVFVLTFFVFELCISKLPVVFLSCKDRNISITHSGLSPPVPAMA